MQQSFTDFPYYRKLVDKDVWYKITSKDHFVEIQKMGAKFISHEVFAHQYPEKLRISDMLTCNESRWEEIQEKDYDRVESQLD